MCVFRSNEATHSGPKKPPIPDEQSHPFRSKGATHSGPMQSTYGRLPEQVAALRRNGSPIVGLAMGLHPER